MVFRRVAILLAAVLTAVVTSAQTAYVVPVVTAQVKERIYTTTLAVRNDGARAATCEAIYAIPNDPKGGTLRARYEVPPGGTPQVERDVLIAAGAVGTMRVVCSAPVAIASRIHASTDGGTTFDDGRTYAAVDEATAFRRSRSVGAGSDLFVAEVAGRAMKFDAVVSNRAGAVLARKSYEVPPFAQQIVNLSKVRQAHASTIAELRVQIRVTSGEGALVVGSETTDLSLLAMTAPRPADAVQAAHSQTAPAMTPPQPARQVLGTAAFHAAPFQDSFTGLVYFRNRWYDPTSGSWLTPDRRGYEDSSNLYSGFAGDPVNKRDPTGEAASMARNGWIIATDNRNGGRLVRFSPEQIAKEPAEVRRFLGQNADLSARDADALIARAGHLAALGNLRGIAAARRGAQIAEPGVTAAGTALHVMSGFTGVGGAAQLTQAFGDQGATKVNLGMAGLTLVGLGGADDLIRLGSLADDAVEIFSVVPYRPSLRGVEQHHGILDVWASANVPGYASRAARTPSMVLTPVQHEATKRVFRDWLYKRTGKRVGGRVDWKSVTSQEIQTLTEEMFDAAGVPEAARRAYYRAFHQYIYSQ